MELLFKEGENLSGNYVNMAHPGAADNQVKRLEL